MVQARGVEGTGEKPPLYNAALQREAERVAAGLAAREAGHTIQDTPEEASKVADELETTWPTRLVGYGDSGLERDDRVIAVYREQGLDRQLELIDDPGEALALVYPMTARSFSRLHIEIHYGIEAIALQPDESEPEGDEAEESSGALDNTAPRACRGLSRRQLPS